MGQSNGHAGVAIFAADGSGRHRLVRVGFAAGAALLAAWLIALALGVLGGFDSLPGLPTSRSGGSHEAGSRTHRPAAATPAPLKAQEAGPLKTVAPSPVSDNSSSTHTPSSTPKSSAAPVVQQPSTSASSTTATHGKSATATTQPTGKPAGSPGNGTGGSGAPGQLR
jgi:hypothetical protein